MKPLKYLATIYAMALSSGMAATTDPVGFVNVTVKANSDALIAVPLNRASAFKGAIQSITGSTITVAGVSPAWSTNLFVQNLPAQPNTYALQLASGAQEGLTVKITASGANTITIQLTGGDSLTGVKTEAVDGAGQGDQVDIVPYWTPGSLLPATLPAGAQFFGYEGGATGTNLSSSQVYGYSGSAWEDDVTSEDATNTPIAFGSAFILRNNSGSDISVSMVGSVPMTSHRIRLANPTGGEQDIRIGYSSPIPEPISALGIPANAGDVIFGYDNAQSGINKSASKIYAFDGTGWVDDVSGLPVTASDALQPGFGYVYRKLATGSPQSVVWQDLQSYLAP